MPIGFESRLGVSLIHRRGKLAEMIGHSVQTIAETDGAVVLAVQYMPFRGTMIAREESVIRHTRAKWLVFWPSSVHQSESNRQSSP